MIRFEGVTITVRGKLIARDLSFALGAGEKLVIQGKSGGGKSTLLKTIVGGHGLEAGRIVVNGLAVIPENIRQVRSRVAYIPQELTLTHETAREDLLLPFSFKAHRGSRPEEREIRAVLERLRLSPALLDQESASLSGGEKQRLIIARAILLNKKIFLADEITSALDRESKEAVLQFFLEPGQTVLSVSHDSDWIARCGRVFTLANETLREAA